MKKTIKVLGLLLVAAAMFTGCDFGKTEEKKDGDLCEPLFDLSETTVNTHTIKLTNGNWTFREYDKDADYDRIISDNLYFTVKDGVIDRKADYSFVEQQLYTEITTYKINSLKENDYEGDELFWYKELDKKQIDKIVASDTYAHDYDSKVKWMMGRVADDNWMPSATVKTNSAGTKFAWTIYTNEGGDYHYYYLAKD